MDGPLNLAEWALQNSELLAKEAQRFETILRRYEFATAEEVLADLNIMVQMAVFKTHQEKLQRGEK